MKNDCWGEKTDLAFKNIADLKRTKGVFMHCHSQKFDLYERMWSVQNEDQLRNKLYYEKYPWGRGRVRKLLELLSGYNCHTVHPHPTLRIIKELDQAVVDTVRWHLNDKIVLDACCGLGRFSVASLELGAKTVYSFDGTFEGPYWTYQRIKDKNIPNEPDVFAGQEWDYGQADIRKLENLDSRLVPVQGDIENICDIFKENSFDVIIHSMALMHTRDWKKTLHDLSLLLGHEGILAFDFFPEGTTPSLTRDLRDIFKKIDLDLTYRFLQVIGNIKGHEDMRVCYLHEMLTNDDKFSEFKKIINELRTLTEMHPIGLINDRLRLEDLKTPFLRNLSPEDVCNFIRDDLDLIPVLGGVFEHKCVVVAVSRQHPSQQNF